MSTTIQPFDFDGAPLRALVGGDGEPRFIAGDVAKILGYREAYYLTRDLDEDEKGPQIVGTPGGDQQVTVITEAGLYSAILRSRVEGAKRFKRWVTHDVLPAIRKTGTYQAPTGPELMAAALLEAAETIKARDERLVAQTQQIAAMKPRAQAWDMLASTDGDYSLRDAAQILDRHPDISTGQNRLGAYLREIGWVDRKGVPYQRHVDNGRLRSRARYYTHERTGERVLADPQIRITPRGVEKLQELLTAGAPAVLDVEVVTE